MLIGSADWAYQKLNQTVKIMHFFLLIILEPTECGAIQIERSQGNTFFLWCWLVIEKLGDIKDPSQWVSAIKARHFLISLICTCTQTSFHTTQNFHQLLANYFVPSTTPQRINTCTACYYVTYIHVSCYSTIFITSTKTNGIGTGGGWFGLIIGQSPELETASFRDAWTAAPDMFNMSGRHALEDDEEELKWAAIDGLPTFERMRKGVLKYVHDDGHVVLALMKSMFYLWRVMCMLEVEHFLPCLMLPSMLLKYLFCLFLKNLVFRFKTRWFHCLYNF